MIHNKGKIYGDKTLYPDGFIGYCIWWPFPGDPNPESGGLCWDFAGEHIDDVIALLQELRDAEPDIYKEPPENAD